MKMLHLIRGFNGPFPVGPSQGEVSSGNPFVAISNGARIMVIVYFVFWRILPELAGALQFETLAGDIVVARFLARVMLDILLVIPFLLKRFGGTPLGWLHPLILPTMLVIAKDIVLDPFAVFQVITAWLVAPVLPDYRSMVGMPLDVVLSVELKCDLLVLLAQVAYFVGYVLSSRRYVPIVATRQTGVSDARMGFIVGICFAIFFVFIEMNGGLIEHYSSLAYGRHLMGQSSGHFLVIIALLPFLMVLWYVARPPLLSQPWFIIILVATLLVQFATTGSRSSLFLPVVLILASWMMVNLKLPTAQLLVVGGVIVLFFGVLGDLRSSAQSSREGVADLSILRNFDLAANTERTIEHRAKNAEASGKIAIMHAVPESIPHLYGATYIATLAFFIPRTIWPDKPRGPGAHVGAIIYSGLNSTAGYTGTGFPPGGVGEAYWNFGVPGVAVVYILFGLFMRLVTQRYLYHPGHPIYSVVFLMSMLTLGDPSSDELVTFMQALILLLLSWAFVRIPSAKNSGARDKSDAFR